MTKLLIEATYLFWSPYDFYKAASLLMAALLAEVLRDTEEANGSLDA